MQFKERERKCVIEDSLICSQCCGNIRTQEYGKLIDSDAIRIIELLIDKYHFKDINIGQDLKIVINSVNFVDRSTKEDLKNVKNEEIVNILAVIRFVAKRRTQSGREYMCPARSVRAGSSRPDPGPICQAPRVCSKLMSPASLLPAASLVSGTQAPTPCGWVGQLRH
jgi:hypothetical protein